MTTKKLTDQLATLRLHLEGQTSRSPKRPALQESNLRGLTRSEFDRMMDLVATGEDMGKEIPRVTALVRKWAGKANPEDLQKVEAASDDLHKAWSKWLTSMDTLIESLAD